MRKIPYRLIHFVVASVVWIACSSASLSQTITVTFPNPTGFYYMSGYTEQGFRFSATRFEHLPDYRDVSPSTDGMLRMGSADSGILRIEQLSGQPFDLLQVSLQTVGYSTPPNAPWTGTQILTGVLATGGTVQHSFDITQDWASYLLPNTFQNLLYVDVPEVFFGGFQIDDVVLNPNPVPEPNTVAFFILGILCLVFTKGRRLTMRRNEPGMSIAVAIVASRGPGC